MSDPRPTDFIQSVSRALHILDEIGDSGGGASAKQIAARCGLALPTTYHLLRTLCYEGYAVRRPGGNYVLGMKIAERFRDLLTNIERPPSVHHVLGQLSEVTGHTAYFAQLVDGEIVITDLVEGRHSPHLEGLVRGFDEGAHATALGKALLSAMSRPARDSYLHERGLRPFTRQTVRDADRLHWELRDQATRRLFTEEEQYRDGVCCAAVLVSREYPSAVGTSSGTERWAQYGPQLQAELAVRAADLVAASPT